MFRTVAKIFHLAQFVSEINLKTSQIEKKVTFRQRGLRCSQNENCRVTRNTDIIVVPNCIGPYINLKALPTETDR